METISETVNPYAAPTAPEDSPGTITLHNEYQLINGRVICRSGLVLPQFCLVTGGTSDLVPHVMTLRAPAKGMPIYRWWGVGLMLVAPLVFLATFSLMQGGAANKPWAGALFLLIPLLLIVGLVLFLIGGRRGSSCLLEGFVSKRRQSWQKRMVWIPGAAMAGYWILRGSQVVDRDGGVWLIVLFAVLMNLIPLFLLRGLRLRAEAASEGLFEIRGFSKAFLEKLQRHEGVMNSSGGIAAE